MHIYKILRSVLRHAITKNDIKKGLQNVTKFLFNTDTLIRVNLVKMQETVANTCKIVYNGIVNDKG